MKKLLEFFKKKLEIRKLVSEMETKFARKNENFKKKFNPSDYEIKGFTNPYKPDLSSKPTEPTIPMNPKLYSFNLRKPREKC
jgi:hypothetical protein